MKRIFSLIMCLILVFAVGCSKEPENLSSNSESSPVTESVVEKEPEFAVNPLTGIEDLNPEAEFNRPVAIMVNNIEVAQKVQTGLYAADIIYETEVEGGITRLLAVYKDISGVDKIGTVRSARYAFIDLAMGHNAIYVHHGQDSYHAGKHLNDINRFTVSEKAGGARISNGLNREHTLYAYGDSLWELLKGKFKYTQETNTPWQNWADKEQSVAYPNVANSVTVPFSTLSKSVFKYDTATEKYIRFSGDTERKDYVTGQSLYIKNVFVLTTTIRTYPNCTDGYKHKEVFLESGNGYYCVNGTYVPIKWSKGRSSNSFTFTNADSTPLTVAPGNSWVCIAGSSFAPVME